MEEILGHAKRIVYKGAFVKIQRRSIAHQEQASRVEGLVWDKGAGNNQRPICLLPIDVSMRLSVLNSGFLAS
jgi:hypothetical protein